MIAYSGKRMRRYPVILCLACLLFLPGCLDHTPTPAPTPTFTPTATSTPLPTRTATPTPMPVFTMQNLDAQFPDGFLRYNTTFTGLQRGTYIIGAGIGLDSFGNYSNAIYYISLERTQNRDYATFYKVPNYFFQSRTEIVDDESYFTNSGLPEYMSVVAGLTSGHQINKMLIRSANLLSREQHIWSVMFQPASGMQCDDISLSPNHKWVAGNCWKEGENYIYFLNIQQGTVEILRPPNNPCLSREYGEREWHVYDWSPDGQWLSVACPDNHDVYIPYLVSPETDEFYRRPDLEGQPLGLRAWSPDGSKVVMGNFDDYDLLIIDSACLKGTQTCPEYLRVLLPYERSSGIPIITSVVWDPTGEIVVWAGYKSPYQRSDGPTTIGIVNVESGEEYSIGWAPGTTVHSISPDGKWIVIYNTEAGWGLLSIDGLVERGIMSGGYFDEFVGWLVVP